MKLKDIFPQEIITHIYEYDPTYKEKFNKVLIELEIRKEKRILAKIYRYYTYLYLFEILYL